MDIHIMQIQCLFEKIFFQLLILKEDCTLQNKQLVQSRERLVKN